MPAPPQSSAGTASHRNVLLLEEYDALAAAIGSALKKFAPQHTVSVARSPAEAEKLAAKIDPDLFVIDVDPPSPGLTEFLGKMQAAHPRGRALVIGAGIPAEVAEERGSFGALQFINKPFELSAFGAAVQAVLGPWRESESALPRGTLSALSPIDVMLLHCGTGANVTLDVKARDARSGKIHMTEGQISHAETGTLSGADALREILSWPDAHISEAQAILSAHRTIERNWGPVFVEILREAKAKQPLRVSPAEEALPAKPRAKTGKKIVVVDDTEMLLIFVEDTLATADPELQIRTALTGADGIKEIEQSNPDLVLLDYSLPDMNGDEVCQRLLQNEQTARVPVLMMSGHVAEMMETAQRFPNVVATIEKPFLSDALVQLVQKTLAAGPRRTPVRAKTAPAPATKEVTLPKEPAKKPPDQRPPAPKPSPAVTTPLAPEISGPRRAPVIAKTVPAPTLEAVTFPKEIAKKPPDRPLAVEKPAPLVTTPLAPEMFESPEPTTAVRPTVRVTADEVSNAVLGLFLEVVAMQLTPELQMGTIRAKPASFTVSLHLSSPAARSAVPAEIGFQLGATELDRDGKISTLHLIPTSRPFHPSPTRSAFEIGGVAVVPNETRTRVQLTPAGTTPMTMQLIARLDLEAVKLSPSFQVGQLVLKWRTKTVRVSLSSKPNEQSGASFETTSVKLDGYGRIAELILNPAK